MKIDKYLNEVEKVMELDKGVMSLDDTLDQYASWDSLAVLSFIAMVDTLFDFRVAASDVNACKTISHLVELLGDKIEK